MATSTIEPRQLQRLLDVGRALVAMHEPDEVLHEVLVAARDLTGARYAALGVLDADKQSLARFLTIGIDDETRERIGPLPSGHGILGELIRRPEPLRLERISDHPRSYGFPAQHPPMSSFLGVPVRIRDEVFGNLYLTEKVGAEHFGEQDEELLIVLAEWAAIAVDNARAHSTGQARQEELERAVRGLGATVSLNREVGGETDLPRVLELVVKRGRALVSARGCIVFLLDGEDTLHVASIAGEIPPSFVGTALAGESPARDVLRAGHGQRISPEAVGRFGDLDLAAQPGLLVPLRSRGRDIGVLGAFDCLASDAGFSADDTLALESFATTAATAIHSTQSIEDEKLRLSIDSAERERRRWARELHDETLQELGALSVMLESAGQIDDPGLIREALGRSSEQVGRVIDGLQGLITELRPASLDDLGVGAAVEALVERLRARSELTINLDVDLAYESGREATRPPPELEAVVYRTVQEALNNVIKHAAAGRARVMIEERNSAVSVTVEDDGSGFVGAGAHDGFGLLGMKERVALAEGEVDIRSVLGEGTRVTARFPSVRSDPSAG